MSWSKRLKDPSEIMKAGEQVEVIVLKVDKANKKISLGYKQILANPWDELKARHPEGSVVEGVVKNVADFGVFVDIGEEIDGLVHVSDLSWNTRIKNPGELFKKGDRVQAKVLKVDPDAQKFSLGIKHLTEDPWAGIEKRFKKGDLVTGKVTRVADFGAFVEIADGIEGLVHVSEISREKVENPAAVVKAGDEVGAVVLGVDRANKKVSLSIRGYQDALERKDTESYMEKQPDGSRREHRRPRGSASREDEVQRRARGLTSDGGRRSQEDPEAPQAVSARVPHDGAGPRGVLPAPAGHLPHGRLFPVDGRESRGHPRSRG